MDDENVLYEQWLSAIPEQRPDVEQKLYEAVSRHARAICWEKLCERNDDLIHDTASEVIRQLPAFRGESKFSTWVQGIAQKKVALEIRDRQYHRELFDENTEIRAEQPNDLEATAARSVFPAVRPRQYDGALLADIAERLSPEDQAMFRGMAEGKEQDKLAKDQGISPHAAESRRRRLKAKVRKKYFTGRDG